jgi:hypothetical protein
MVICCPRTITISYSWPLRSSFVPILSMAGRMTARVSWSNAPTMISCCAWARWEVDSFGTVSSLYLVSKSFKPNLGSSKPSILVDRSLGDVR